ncbi:hypothetical protein RYX36_028268 [Vicia faba]
MVVMFIQEHKVMTVKEKCVLILNILKGCDEKEKNLFKSQESDRNYLENQKNIDDEVYSNASAELHLNLVLLDVDNDSASYSSIEKSNN